MLTGTLDYLSKTLRFANACTAKKRQILIDLHGERCYYCGATPDYYEIDHVHPLSRGGTDALTNLVLSCIQCNQTKGGKGINQMGNAPRALKEAVLRTLQVLHSTRKWTYKPSKTYFHLNGDVPYPIKDISDDITPFGEMIENARMLTGISKRGMIKRLNCYEKKWNNYLTRENIFGESQLPHLSELLHIPMKTLLHAYMLDVFEYALERQSLSQVWKKDFLQAFIERCEIENRYRQHITDNPPDPAKLNIGGLATIHRNLQIGRPPGKRNRDRIKEVTGFDVFLPETIEAFRTELQKGMCPMCIREETEQIDTSIPLVPAASSVGGEFGDFQSPNHRVSGFPQACETSPPTANDEAPIKPLPCPRDSKLYEYVRDRYGCVVSMKIYHGHDKRPVTYRFKEMPDASHTD